MNANPLEPAADFLHFVHTVAFNNSYWVALYHNLWKAQSQWGVVTKVLTKTGATVRVRVMLCKVMLQQDLGGDRSNVKINGGLPPLGGHTDCG